MKILLAGLLTFSTFSVFADSSTYWCVKVVGITKFENNLQLAGKVYKNGVLTSASGITENLENIDVAAAALSSKKFLCSSGATRRVTNQLGQYAIEEDLD